MRLTTLKCDRCGKEVNWLYDMPRLIVEGLTINTYPHQYEMCKKCAEEVCKKFNNAAKDDKWNVQRVLR